MTLSTDIPAVRNAIAAIATDCKRLSEVGSQGESLAFAMDRLSRIEGAIDVICGLLGKDHFEVERLTTLGALAYFDAAKRIEKRDAATTKPVTVTLDRSRIPAILDAISTAIDDSIHFERDSDEGDTRREDEQDALGYLSASINTANLATATR